MMNFYVREMVNNAGIDYYTEWQDDTTIIFYLPGPWQIEVNIEKETAILYKLVNFELKEVCCGLDNIYFWMFD